MQADLAGHTPRAAWHPSHGRPGPGERACHDAGLDAQHFGADALYWATHPRHSLAGEGHQQDTTRIDVIDDRVDYFMGQGVALAYFGLNDDEPRRCPGTVIAADPMFDKPPLRETRFGEVVWRHL